MELITKISEQLSQRKDKWSTNFEIRNKAHILADKIFELTYDKSHTELKAERDLIGVRLLLADLMRIITGKEEVKKQVEHFLQQIPRIFDILITDIEATMQFDPAAKDKIEIVLSFPGIYAITIYRFSNILCKMNIPVLPKLMSQYAHSKTGIDIHPAAEIKESFFIDHGTGVVIGETTIIKKNVKIYQGATLGALSVDKKLAHKKRHPTIEENVVIYSNATILGGNTTIGEGSIIGGNVFLTKSVPPKSIVYALNETNVKSKIDESKVINFRI